jgi:hypothetical protein
MCTTREDRKAAGGHQAPEGDTATTAVTTIGWTAPTTGADIAIGWTAPTTGADIEIGWTAPTSFETATTTRSLPGGPPPEHSTPAAQFIFVLVALMVT